METIPGKGKSLQSFFLYFGYYYLRYLYIYIYIYVVGKTSYPIFVVTQSFTSFDDHQIRRKT